MVVVVVLYERKKKKEEIPLQKRERLEVEKMERFLLFCKVDDREGREFLVVLSFKFFFFFWQTWGACSSNKKVGVAVSNKYKNIKYKKYKNKTRMVITIFFFVFFRDCAFV